jgi:hypothetical protein
MRIYLNKITIQSKDFNIRQSFFLVFLILYLPLFSGFQQNKSKEKDNIVPHAFRPYWVLAFNLSINDSLYKSTINDTMVVAREPDKVYFLIQQAYNTSRSKRFRLFYHNEEGSRIFFRFTYIIGAGIDRLAEMNTDSSIARLVDMLDFYTGEYYGDRLSNAIIGASHRAIPFLEKKLSNLRAAACKNTLLHETTNKIILADTSKIKSFINIISKTNKSEDIKRDNRNGNP